MKDFTTALLVQPTHHGDPRAKGVQFLSTCKLCRESHKTQVWLCFLVLSFLSTSTCVALDYTEALISLEALEHTIEKSDAMLYAPEIKGECLNMSLKCYILELIMVIHEEEVVNNKDVDYFYDLKEKLHPEANNLGCSQCEAYPLENITIFLERLKDLLRALNMANSAK